MENRRDVGSTNCKGDEGFLWAGDGVGRREFKSFDGDTDVKSNSNELIGDKTLPLLEWTKMKIKIDEFELNQRASKYYRNSMKD